MRALHKTGLGNEYLQHLDSWKNMLAQGLTTFAEKENDTRSDCHAWSSSPMIGFLQVVCGIEPAAPGFSAVRIQPNMNNLTEVEGSMPHPLGEIWVKLVKKENDELKADIRLPDGVKGEFIWNGEKINLISGLQKISR
jgi:hypothetical protein